MRIHRNLYGLSQGILLMTLLYVSFSFIYLNPHEAYCHTANHITTDSSGKPINNYLLLFIEEAAEGQERDYRNFLLLVNYSYSELIDPIRKLIPDNSIRKYQKPLVIRPGQLKLNCVLII